LSQSHNLLISKQIQLVTYEYVGFYTRAVIGLNHYKTIIIDIIQFQCGCLTLFNNLFVYIICCYPDGDGVYYVTL
jgi:hypothetical protein